MAALGLESMVPKELFQQKARGEREAGGPHLAAVVQAAERGQVVVGLQGADTDGTVVRACGGGLGLGHAQPSGQQQWLRIITVVLQQLFGTPVRVSQKVLSDIWL